jgi:O-antigen/teichoic acid export membrane protein
MSVYRGILKHASVYGIGQILSRFASFLMLPVYTYFLRPADYGIIAILDVASGVLFVCMHAGMASAVTRYHCEATNAREKAQVWWTGLTVLGIIGLVFLGPAWLGRGLLSRLLLGLSPELGGYYCGLVLVTLYASVLNELADAFLRAQKWSTWSVGLSQTRLACNIALNVYFLSVQHLGVEGVLLGNLLATSGGALIQLSILIYHIGRYSFSFAVAARLWRFGSPFIAVGLLSLIMHQGDRPLLRFFANMSEVGIYSLAYQMGWAFNSLFLISFWGIWSVAMYDVAARPDAQQAYIRIYRCFTGCLFLFMLAAAILSRPILALMANKDYGEAARLVPIICLAYVFFTLASFFSTPAYVAKRTERLISGAIVGAVVNVVLNLLFIPAWGALGAAWSTVLTFMAYAAVYLIVCQRITHVRYPLVQTALLLLAFVVAYLTFIFLQTLIASLVALYAVGACIWLVMAALAFAPLLPEALALLKPGAELIGERSVPSSS